MVGAFERLLIEGPITIGEIITVLPFGNTLAMMNLTGAEIKATFETSLRNLPQKMEVSYMFRVQEYNMILPNQLESVLYRLRIKLQMVRIRQSLIIKHIQLRRMHLQLKVETDLMC